MIEKIGEDADAEERALVQMRIWYARAEGLARARADSSLFYPALNRMAAELIVDAKDRSWGGFDPAALASVRASLDAKIRDAPDFWSVAGLTELRLYEALAEGKLAPEVEAIEHQYEDLWARVKGYGDWRSVDGQLRFVLTKYIARATKREQDAAKRLIQHFRRLIPASDREQ
jgi:hypothetical protein